MLEDITNPAILVRLPKPTRDQNRKIITYIHENYYKKLILSDFSSVVFYSARHLSRIFQDDLRISIFEYLRLYRMLMASAVLTGSEKNITEIAFDSGYESISTFYKDFNKYFGMSPKTFRKKVNNSYIAKGRN